MLQFSTIAQYHLQLKQGQTTCKLAVEHYLKNIAAQQQLNAFIEVYSDEALARATALDESRVNDIPLKKLHGVIIAIKDVICYKGHKVSAASAMLQNFESLFTATALQYLIDEDAIIIGNCNCDEFAMGSSNENSIYGPVLNAADKSRVPGGSSGGSAVAVQADLCMVSLGSDTGGSVRQPADFCGVIGFKPGYGNISRYGLIAYASSFDQIGIFGKSIEDISLLLQVMQQHDTRDSTMNLSNACPSQKKPPFRFCYFKQALQHPALDGEIALALTNLIAGLKEEGHTVTELDFKLLDFIVPTYYVLTTAEASSNLARYDGVRYGHQSLKKSPDLRDFYVNNRTEGFGKEVKRRIMLGTFVLSTGYYDAYFAKAQQVRRLLAREIGEITANFDGILSPTSPTPAFPIGIINKDPTEVYLADIFTVLANLTGIPAISLPL
ncbi:MAG: Asp-tRNA(Asn)/Glu-tRNA(Gln) amidotransferase subunit GatA, partial [Ferruginibacter sp.]